MDDQTLPTRIPHESAEREWGRAGLKLIPYIGDALDELAYGHLDKARWDRLDRTLRELAAMMEARDIPAAEVTKEEFANLLEAVAPHISRTTSEKKRETLRDLLLNAVSLPSGDSEWESARLAGDLIVKLDAVALSILASLAALGAKQEEMATLRSLGDGESAEVVRKGAQSIPLDFRWLVVDHAYWELSSQPAQLVLAGARREDFVETRLTELGEFLIGWATADPVAQ